MRHEPSRLVLETYPHVRELSLVYADMDTVGHVNNVSIARFFEEGRASLHYRIDELYQPDSPRSLMLAHVEIDYLGEVVYPGEVTVGIGVARLGTSSCQLAAALFQHEACVALMTSIDVNTSESRGRPAPIPDDYRAALEKMTLRESGA